MSGLHGDERTWQGKRRNDPGAAYTTPHDEAPPELLLDSHVVQTGCMYADHTAPLRLHCGGFFPIVLPTGVCPHRSAVPLLELVVCLWFVSVDSKPARARGLLCVLVRSGAPLAGRRDVL
jgi:hypothetical protein